MMRHRYPIMVVGRLSLLLAALVSLFIVWSLQPRGTGVAALLGLWLLLPYAVLAVLLENRSSVTTKPADVATMLLVVAGGLLFLIVVIFVDPDPQGGIAVLFTPVYQGIAIVALLPITRWLLRRKAGAPAPDGSSDR
jgi:hypothetical protein